MNKKRYGIKFPGGKIKYSWAYSREQAIYFIYWREKNKKGQK